MHTHLMPMYNLEFYLFEFGIFCFSPLFEMNRISIKSIFCPSHEACFKITCQRNLTRSCLKVILLFNLCFCVFQPFTDSYKFSGVCS